MGHHQRLRPRPRPRLNGLDAGLPLNGMDTGELCDLYPNLFVPAGLTFSIWGVTYGWLLAFVAHGSSRGHAAGGALDRIGPWCFVNCVAK